MRGRQWGPRRRATDSELLPRPRPRSSPAPTGGDGRGPSAQEGLRGRGRGSGQEQGKGRESTEAGGRGGRVWAEHLRGSRRLWGPR